VYTEQARAAETALGEDGDDDEHILETLRLTGRDCNQCNPVFQFNVFVVTKYMTLYYFSDAIRGWTLI
jgi:hypothetical protein